MGVVHEPVGDSDEAKTDSRMNPRPSERTSLTLLSSPKEPCVQQRRGVSGIDALNRHRTRELVRAASTKSLHSNGRGLQIVNLYRSLLIDDSLYCDRRHFRRRRRLGSNNPALVKGNVWVPQRPLRRAIQQLRSFISATHRLCLFPPMAAWVESRRGLLPYVPVNTRHPKAPAN